MLLLDMLDGGLTPAQHGWQLTAHKTHHPSLGVICSCRNKRQTNRGALGAANHSHRLFDRPTLNWDSRFLVLGDGDNPVADVDVFLSGGGRVWDNAFDHEVLAFLGQGDTDPGAMGSHPGGCGAGHCGCTRLIWLMTNLIFRIADGGYQTPGLRVGSFRPDTLWLLCAGAQCCEGKQGDQKTSLHAVASLLRKRMAGSIRSTPVGTGVKTRVHASKGSDTSLGRRVQ